MISFLIAQAETGPEVNSLSTSAGRVFVICSFHRIGLDSCIERKVRERTAATVRDWAATIPARPPPIGSVEFAVPRRTGAARCCKVCSKSFVGSKHWQSLSQFMRTFLYFVIFRMWLPSPCRWVPPVRVPPVRVPPVRVPPARVHALFFLFFFWKWFPLIIFILGQLQYQTKLIWKLCSRNKKRFG